MPRVEFLPSKASIDVPSGTGLLDAARQAGVEMETPCGAEGTCGGCIVRITDGDVDSDSLGVLPATAVASGHVLTCKTRILDTPLTVEIPESVGAEGGQIDARDETYLVRRELLPKKWEHDPLATKWLFQVAPPKPEDGLSDLDRLTRAIQMQWGKLEVTCSLRVMQGLADCLRIKDGLVTVTLVWEGEKLHVVGLEAGDHTTRNFAIAVDVGTTTVAVQLINLTRGEILATRSSYNGQVTYGADVISRINYARRPSGLGELQARVLGTINELIKQVVRGRGIEPHEITNAVVSANTTMNHLLLGLKPEYIRLDPYTPTLLGVPYLTAREVGIGINPDSWVCFSPNCGSYVGGDITAGLLCTELATDTEDINLFIDIGTNGEIVIGNRDFLMACACSAGPAFEGGGIECGMRAATGAIERVAVDPETGAPQYATIGNAPPQGICGSGMIDLLANLFATGWIDPAGKFERSRSSSHILMEGSQARYIIVPREESGTGEAITISELDVDNIIRAKAAIYSACALILEQLAIGFDDLKHIYIAGGFGRYLPLEKAITIGLAPDVPRERFQFIGNASLMGSFMVVVSRDFRRRQMNLAQRMTYIDLSNNPGYMEEYMGAMFLPHTDETRFPTVQSNLAAW
jgi:uncharacterized 2Fe-2S/4Fe-4S cluster protein (DUF4445 family)